MYLLYIRRGAQDQEIIYKFQIIVFDLFGLFCVLSKFFEFELFRVGNSLFGFSSESLIFCERKSKIVICSFPRVNHSRSLFLKSDGVKSDGSVSLKRGKAVKNCQKHGENHELF